MGMMKEHVRGPIKCCETIAADVLHKTRAEELVFNPGFKAVEMDTNLRQKKDSHGGTSTARFLGVPIVKTDKDVLNRMLQDLLKDEVVGGWEYDDYGHDDLVIEEYTKVTIGASSYFTVDWTREDYNTTANYFLYYPIRRIDHDVLNRDSGEPVPPSMEDLESLVKPPADYIKGMSDYYYHQYVGQVNA
jgi:hypothetical protein